MENDVERTDEDASRRSRRSGRQRRRRSTDTSNSGFSQLDFFRHYCVEIFALCLLATGIFLLVEQLEIKVVIHRYFVRITQQGSNIVSYLVSTVLGVQTSDIVGLVLTFAAILLIVWRLRYRVIEKYKYLDDLIGCPNCGENLKRLPRQNTHRAMEFLFRVHIKRYSCAKCPFHASSWENSFWVNS